ncbi:MAG: hypothetical protein OXI22_17555 [Defluviicoccus sp.]|nr:hypothetical protein [Defluviicoccus sp.]MDE0385694.1 hypothetical protein [Defluviicoccus sp.]
MAGYTVPAFARFIDDLRAHFAKHLPEEERWRGVKDLLRILVDDPEMRAASRGWTAKKGREYVLHHDPDRGFFVGALVREPGHRAFIHDHAHTWTVYGVLDGAEITHVYARTDDGTTPGKATLELIDRHDAPAGHVDLIGPWVPHSEWGASDRSVAITVRSDRPGGYSQNRFFPETGSTDDTHRGLVLVPLAV